MTEHDAITAISNKGVCSIGKIARNAGTTGASRNALIPTASSRHDLRLFTGAAVAVMLGGVSLEVRDDREIARALDCGGQLALMARACSAQAARQNLSLVSDETAKGTIVLIIDPAHASFAERAALLWSSHDWLVLVV